MKLRSLPARETYDSFREYEVDNWQSIVNNKLFYFKEIGKIVSQKKNYIKRLKSVRSLYLFLIRNKYQVFSFRDMRYWKSVANKKREFEQHLVDELGTKEEFTIIYIKYMVLALKTLRNYDSTYADTIAMTLFRKFPHDIAREIMAFI